ncbi:MULTISPECIES: glycosyltransferase family 2 protein [Acinetobacter calcoaceticus/baumannii complex]|uniref:glycosyltransferase family 2 protein n=1 Tax=Acinetobacter calcoaceticus/baumannii complex TaxID=909768 RepID=UPI000E5A8DBD|nr:MULTISPECIES: glycosyltransferase [Acinetobacter calcoaceticus/baumannii complex]MCU4428004.1 glycosyltransferase [Acinetobacter pittii]MDQ9759190.1 glycosyltransferase [Acinetobacter baumannii]MDR9526648.1 glycosyltransferase [Acinetobacter baumannii]
MNEVAENIVIEKKLSIIVPVYGVEDYILEFLESIVPQLQNSTELIIVNDGTKDHSMTKCREYLGSDYKNVVLLEQENQGQSVARNYGLRIAKGQYIGFLDPDDYVCEYYIAQILSVIENNNDVDIIDFKAVSFIDKSKEKISIINEKFKEGLYVEDTLDSYLKNVFKECSWQSWLRVVKKTLIKDIKFPVGLLIQDVHVFPILYLNSLKIYHIAECIVYYRMRAGSAVTTINKKQEKGYREALVKLLSITDNKDIVKYSVEKIFENYLYVKSKNDGGFKALLGFLKDREIFKVNTFFILMRLVFRKFGFGRSEVDNVN